MIMKRLRFPMVLTAVSAVLAGAALATPPSAGVVGTIMARANFQDQVDLKLKIKGHGQGQEIIQVNDARETVMQKIEIPAFGSTGWHSHPGPVVVLVTAGELTLSSEDEPGCTGLTYSIGQAFVDSGQGHVHNARNLSGQATVLWVTYFDVPPGGALRIDAPAPENCGF
jgi:quercetin dioxygenase-like cupin family protein